MSDTPMVPNNSNRQTLYRCSVCGKWSHAKKEPKTHKRFIAAEHLPDGDMPRINELVNGLRVIAVEDGYWSGDPNYDDGSDGGVWVACGPFNVWEAKRMLITGTHSRLLNGSATVALYD